MGGIFAAHRSARKSSYAAQHRSRRAAPSSWLVARVDTNIHRRASAPAPVARRSTDGRYSVWKATSDSAGSVFGVARQDSRADFFFFFFFFFFFCKETQGLEPTTHVLEVQHLRHLRQKNNFKKMYIFFFFLRGFFFSALCRCPLFDEQRSRPRRHQNTFPWRAALT